MNVDLKEFRAAFVAEADEHLATVRRLLLEVERLMRAKKSAPRELRELLRLLHTLKGLSAMVGVEPIVILSHKMESVLRTAERSGGSLGERAIEILLRAAESIAKRIRAVAEEQTSVPHPSPELLEALDNLLRRSSAHTRASAPTGAIAALKLEPAVTAKLSASEEEQIRTGARAGRFALRADFSPSPDKAARGLSITSVRARVEAIAEIVKIVPLSTPRTPENPGGLLFALLLLTDASLDAIAEAVGIDASSLVEILPRGEPVVTPEEESDLHIDRHDEEGFDKSEPGASPTYESSHGMLRVEVSRVDDAIDMLSDLVVTRSRMALAVERLEAAGVDTRELRGIMIDNARQLRELRAAILRVRMVPIAAVLDRLQLVVRGLARTTGKRVRLKLDVGAAELDKTVAERLFPALVHLIRNAVDHGVEPPEERARLGKDEMATVTIQSVSLDRNVEIKITDDGRGVDRAAVAHRAKRSLPISDTSLLDALCESGLSTRAEADTTSGRGLGMDIVRKIVTQGLSGELSLSTQAGVGTTFTLRVPLTVAIVDAFIVRSGEHDQHRFAVPVSIVEEIVEIPSAERIVTGPRGSRSHARLLPRRGETVPLFELGAALASSDDPTKDAPAATHAPSPHALIIRKSHGELVAFGVARVLSQQEIVVRPLADPLVASITISGSTDLGDGKATVVLDLLALSSRLEGESKATRKEHAA